MGKKLIYRNKNKAKKSTTKIILISWLTFTLILGLCLYHFLFFERIYPNTFVSGINIGGLTHNEAKTKLFSVSFPKQLIFSLNDKQFSLDSKDIEANYDADQTTLLAYQQFRNGNLFQQIFLPFKQLINKDQLPLIITYNQEAFDLFLKQIEKDELVLAIKPKVLVKNQEIYIDQGKKGEAVNYQKAKQNLTSALEYGYNNTIEIPVTVVDKSLNQEQTDILQKRGENLLKKRVFFTFENEEYVYQNQSLINLINPYTGFDEDEIEILIDELSKKVEREAQNPVFIFENDRVKEFSPATNGVKVLKQELKDKITYNLEKLEKSEENYISIEIPTEQSLPEYQTSQVNDLGINTLIGMGKSKFSHSISSRIHNIVLAASKFNGILIKPGESFSFNKTLGDVSSYTGYQQAYIIKDGQTILGDGGGVCQVSTTLFRALLNAGLPINERRAHAYRVSYYEEDSPPGLDATVYDPSPDLKFTNDTPGHLLIQTKTDTSAKTLRFEIYGTNDGRVATISKPTITNVTPPPDDLYIDDPTLPTGTIKQIDWKAWGAKVNFKYTVTRNNEVLIDKIFYSNYQPWQAKFLRGTGAAH